MKRLQEQLEQYGKNDYYPFHMPGHKRNTSLMKMPNPYQLDITEIDGFDNLHLAEGILKEMMEEASSLYGSKKSYYLINGSTCGILIGMAAATIHGDKVIMARNSHRAVYHGLYLNELKPVYLYPQEIPDWGISGPILAENVDKALEENPDAKMVIITSPTYEGVVSDIGAIAKVVHKRGIPLMVDEAHGAHFGFDCYFPGNSISQGADLVIHSVHKTLPSFTQTALLHLQGNLVDETRMQMFFSMYQSSSPSYLLMAGIQESLRLAASRHDLWQAWKANLEYFYEQAQKLTHIRVLGKGTGRDPSKLILSVRDTDINGAQFYQRLRDDYHLQMEAQFTDYVIAMTSLADTSDGFKRLLRALGELDVKITEADAVKGSCCPVLPRLAQAMIPYEAGKQTLFPCRIKDSVGLVSGEYAFLYPPGIPLVVPGEIISEELVHLLGGYRQNGLSVKGLEDSKTEDILVIGGNVSG